MLFSVENQMESSNQLDVAVNIHEDPEIKTHFLASIDGRLKHLMNNSSSTKFKAKMSDPLVACSLNFKADVILKLGVMHAIGPIFTTSNWKDLFISRNCSKLPSRPPRMWMSVKRPSASLTVCLRLASTHSRKFDKILTRCLVENPFCIQGENSSL
ncbi:hypothetical protein ACH5RR_023972 [Cinchona calisaya]|uniref:Uncharacterized protein n=1 Tax=Cinchona calisaya TaxID=153742 RepID=A0ABD2ZC64_9GENT